MIYLDHNATTRPDPEVVRGQAWAAEQAWGNPSTAYTAGREARELLDRARARVAALIGAPDPAQVLFTSGGTEADVAALRGVLGASHPGARHLVTTLAEHKAVLRTCVALDGEGIPVSFLPVDGEGRIEPDTVGHALGPETALVSVLLANNEVGTVNPVAEIAARCRQAGVPVHTDAVQAAGKIPLDVEALGVDLLTLSAHKIHGPRGIGALWVRPGTPLSPLLTGGNQERGLRAGTENVAAAYGFGLAADLASQRLAEDAAAIRVRRDRLWQGLQDAVPGACAHGDLGDGLPNTLSVFIPGWEAEALVLALDAAGIAVGTGSACTTGDTRPSHVLLAMGIAPARAHNSIRFSLGRDNTAAEIDRTLATLARLCGPSTR